ncbi:MAG: Fic family protein [Candidatus Marinimicrobia bacterium]|nr:Fic family protein [Candidatus Neomarinimicrobiota bacterium]
MILFPHEKIEIDEKGLAELDRRMKEIYRTIIFNRNYSADELLDTFIQHSNSLTEMLSIKNAQMEAQNEEEVALYLRDLNLAINSVMLELSKNVNFTSLSQFFHLFRIISPDTHSRHPNRFRERLVQIGSYVCPDPAFVSGLMEELFHTLPQIKHPVTRAIYFHHEAIRIHPFIDGNGRTVRIAKNWILMYEMYPPIFIRDEQEKQQYISTLGWSFEALNKDPFNFSEPLEAFFDQELNRLIDSADIILSRINEVGK